MDTLDSKNILNRSLQEIIEREGELERIRSSFESLLVCNNIFAIVFDEELRILGHTLPLAISQLSLEDYVFYLGTEVVNKVKGAVASDRSNPVKDETHITFHDEEITYTLHMTGKERRTYMLQLSAAPSADRSEQPQLDELWQQTSDRLSDVQKLITTLDDIRKIGSTVNQKDVRASIQDQYLPNLRQLKETIDDPIIRLCLDIIEKNLNEIVSPDARSMPPILYERLTPSELQIAEFIRMGKTTKDIADALDIATKTVENHRNNLREKLGIRNKGVNLRSYLMNLDRSAKK